MGVRITFEETSEGMLIPLASEYIAICWWRRAKDNGGEEKTLAGLACWMNTYIFTQSFIFS